jgi:hypothetical protein
MWYRVFCRSGDEPKPDDLLARLQSPDRPVTARFKGDDLGWTAAEFTVGTGTPIYVERYLTTEDNLREDLNTWAAWLETLDYSPNNLRLMEHVFQSRQMMTVRKPLDCRNESTIEELCRALCQALAGAADGVYQIEGDGWYSPTGELLLTEY